MVVPHTWDTLKREPTAMRCCEVQRGEKIALPETVSERIPPPPHPPVSVVGGAAGAPHTCSRQRRSHRSLSSACSVTRTPLAGRDTARAGQQRRSRNLRLPARPHPGRPRSAGRSSAEGQVPRSAAASSSRPTRGEEDHKGHLADSPPGPPSTPTRECRRTSPSRIPAKLNPGGERHRETAQA